MSKTETPAANGGEPLKTGYGRAATLKSVHWADFMRGDAYFQRAMVKLYGQPDRDWTQGTGYPDPYGAQS